MDTMSCDIGKRGRARGNEKVPLNLSEMPGQGAALRWFFSWLISRVMVSVPFLLSLDDKGMALVVGLLVFQQGHLHEIPPAWMGTYTVQTSLAFWDSEREKEVQHLFLSFCWHSPRRRAVGSRY
ncbi:hypothetical protein VTJ04DRAFT_2892 [Mycothermus thermophilus]|uniref:uncharacterized protein n=1 Tax=Humicola insolens TaxID=85995 RepID=UPI003743B8D5